MRLVALVLFSCLVACRPLLPANVLIGQLRDPDEDVREDAANDLRKHPLGSDAAKPLIEAIAREHDSGALRAMLHTLGATGADEALPVLYDAIGRDPLGAQRGILAWQQATGRPVGPPIPTGVAPQPQRDPIAALFEEKGPTMIGPLAPLRFGMTEAEMNAAAPEFADGDHDEYDVTYSVRVQDGILTSAWVRFGEIDVASRIEAAWGEGAPVRTGGNGTTTAWFSRESGIRALLEQSAGISSLDLERYTPIANLAVAGEARLGPLLADLWQKSHAEAKEAYAEHIHSASETELTLYFPPADFDKSFSPVSIDYQGGKPLEIELRMACDLKPSCYEDLYAALEASYGKPRTIEGSRPIHVYRREAPAVAAWSSGSWAMLAVARDPSQLR
jgi:hypothetical protein